MSREQFKREKNYRVSLCISKNLLSSGLINDTDFMEINTMLVALYHPLIGSL